MKSSDMRMNRWLCGSNTQRPSPPTAPLPQKFCCDTFTTRCPVDFRNTEMFVFVISTKWFNPTAPQVSGGT